MVARSIGNLINILWWVLPAPWLLVFQTLRPFESPLFVILIQLYLIALWATTKRGQIMVLLFDLTEDLWHFPI